MNPRINSPSTTRTAFTLVELMVVVILLGMAATLVTVRLEGTSDQARMRGAALRIEQSVRLARLQAQSRHEPAWLAFSIGTDRYRVKGVNQDASHSSRSRLGIWHTLDGPALAAGVLKQRGMLPLRAGDFVVQMTPNGAMLPWALEITAGRLRRVLSCDGFSGRLQSYNGTLDAFRWENVAPGGT